MEKQSGGGILFLQEWSSIEKKYGHQRQTRKEKTRDRKKTPTGRERQGMETKKKKEKSPDTLLDPNCLREEKEGGRRPREVGG